MCNCEVLKTGIEEIDAFLQSYQSLSVSLYFKRDLTLSSLMFTNIKSPCFFLLWICQKYHQILALKQFTG